jgi:uncharacterized RDD family membrane protein YckC
MSNLPPPPGQFPPPPPGSYPPPSGPGPGDLADWGQRALAYLVDFAFSIVIIIVGVILSAILGSISSALGLLVGIITYIGAFAFWIVQMIKQGNTGQTIGKKIIGLKVLKEETGQPIGPGMSIVRWIAHIVDSVICYVGWLFPLWDAKRQTLADKIIGTLVVTVPKQPFNVADLYTTAT